MNCAKLQEDINNLKNHKNALEDYLGRVNSGEVRGTKRELASLTQEVTEATDQILEAYLDDFTEQNPELFEWTLGPEIEGFGGGISITTALSPDLVLVGEKNYGKLRQYVRNPKTNEWAFGPRIEGVDGFVGDIVSFSPDSALIFGYENGGSCNTCWYNRDPETNEWTLGAKVKELEGLNHHQVVPFSADLALIRDYLTDKIYQYTRDPQTNEWTVGSELEVLNKFLDERDTSVNGATFVSPDRIFIGGEDLEYHTGEVYQFIRDPGTGEWDLDVSNSFDHGIHVVTPVSSDSVLIGGRGGEFWQYVRGLETGEWVLSRVDSQSDDERFFEDIGAITLLSSDLALILGRDVELRQCIRNPETNSWELGPDINETGSFDNIRNITPVSSNLAFVLDENYKLRQFTKPPVTLATLKQNFDRIIAKGGEGDDSYL